MRRTVRRATTRSPNAAAAGVQVGGVERPENCRDHAHSGWAVTVTRTPTGAPGEARTGPEPACRLSRPVLPRLDLLRDALGDLLVALELHGERRAALSGAAD